MIETTEMVTARDIENVLLDRCVEVARGCPGAARTQQEANVFRVASMVIVTKFPDEAERLMRVSDLYFEQRPDQMLSSEDVLKKRWIISFSRLRDRLIIKLRSP